MPVNLLSTMRLAGKMPAIAALAYHRASGRDASTPNQRLSYSENFLYMLDAANKPSYRSAARQRPQFNLVLSRRLVLPSAAHGCLRCLYSIEGQEESDTAVWTCLNRPNPRLARAMDIMFTLHAEHEMNCSTAAARHLASSGVDVYTAIAGGPGSPPGALGVYMHGGGWLKDLPRVTESCGQAAKLLRRAGVLAKTVAGASRAGCPMQILYSRSGCMATAGLHVLGRVADSPVWLPGQARWARCTAHCTVAPTRRCCACWSALAASTALDPSWRASRRARRRCSASGTGAWSAPRYTQMWRSCMGAAPHAGAVCTKMLFWRLPPAMVITSVHIAHLHLHLRRDLRAAPSRVVQCCGGLTQEEACKGSRLSRCSKHIPSYKQLLQSGNDPVYWRALHRRVYKNFDPRAKIIREVAEEVFQIQVIGSQVLFNVLARHGRVLTDNDVRCTGYADSSESSAN